MKYSLLFTVLFLIVSCNQKQETPSVETESQKQDIDITKADISAIKYIDIVLGDEGSKAVSDWKSHIELNKIVQDVENANLSYFKNNTEVIDVFIKDFKSTLPKSIDYQSVLGRITVIENAIYKLESAVNLNTTTKEALTKSVKEFLQAISNFNLQINKKFEKERQQIEMP